MALLAFWARIYRSPKITFAKQVAAEESVVDTSDSQGGIEYSDAFLHDNDERFVFNFIRSAMKGGCVTANYVESIDAQRVDDGWQITAKDNESGKQFLSKVRC